MVGSGIGMLVMDRVIIVAMMMIVAIGMCANLFVFFILRGKEKKKL